jgi:hypothetical protein
MDEDHLVEGLADQLRQRPRGNAQLRQALPVSDLHPFYELHGQHARTCQLRVHVRHMHAAGSSKRRQHKASVQVCDQL